MLYAQLASCTAVILVTQRLAEQIEKLVVGLPTCRSESSSIDMPHSTTTDKVDEASLVPVASITSKHTGVPVIQAAGEIVDVPVGKQSYGPHTTTIDKIDATSLVPPASITAKQIDVPEIQRAGEIVYVPVSKQFEPHTTTTMRIDVASLVPLASTTAKHIDGLEIQTAGEIVDLPNCKQNVVPHTTAIAEIVHTPLMLEASIAELELAAMKQKVKPLELLSKESDTPVIQTIGEIVGGMATCRSESKSVSRLFFRHRVPKSTLTCLVLTLITKPRRR